MTALISFVIGVNVGVALMAIIAAGRDDDLD